MSNKQEEKQPKEKKVGRPKKKEDEILTDSSSTLLMSDAKTNKPITIEKVQQSLTSLFQESLSLSGQNLDLGSNIFQDFNPYLQNNRLKLINILPTELSGEKLYEALKEPEYHELEIRGASWFLSATQYIYYKILREAADIPLYKYYINPPLLNDAKDYKEDKFLNELKFVEDWLEKFNLVNTLKRTALEVKREGKCSYVFRQSISNGEKGKQINYVSWQKLPSRYTKLTAIGELGYVASFNLLIFLNPAFKPSQYPDYIQDIWKSLIDNKVVYKNPNKEKYEYDFNALKNFSFINSSGEDVRGVLEKEGKVYMYWVQLPQDLCFTFASDTSHSWAVPDTMGLFTALQELTDYSVLAGMITSSPLTAILTGQAESCPNAGPGQDQTVLSPHTMIAFQNAFNSMVSGNIQAFLAPFKDLKLQSLPDIPNASSIKTAAVQNFVSVAGEGGIISATDKPSVAMIRGAQSMAASQADFVTRQFEAVINKLLNRWCNLKNYWKVNLWGDIFTFDSTVSSLKEQVLGGAHFLIPKLASANNYSLSNIKAVENYLNATQICSAITKKNNTTNAETTNKVGRPALKDNEIDNENTAASVDAGTNVAEGRSFSRSGYCMLCGEIVEEYGNICNNCKQEFGLEEDYL